MVPPSTTGGALVAAPLQGLLGGFRVKLCLYSMSIFSMSSAVLLWIVSCEWWKGQGFATEHFVHITLLSG